jgi:hypothetical protein
MVISMAGRRSKAAMNALKGEMRKLEAEGKSRAEISEILQCTKAQVTRALGAIRPWRGKRAA